MTADSFVSSLRAMIAAGKVELPEDLLDLLRMVPTERVDRVPLAKGVFASVPKRRRPLVEEIELGILERGR